MAKRQWTAFLCALALLISVIPAFAQAEGVTGLTCTRGSNRVTLKWKNPAGFEKNILYVVKNGEREADVELGTSSSYVYQPVAEGDSFVFTLHTVYADETSADTTINYFARYNDTASVPGWTVTVQNKPDFGLSYDESHDGNFSLCFNCENTEDAYYRLYRYGVASKGKSYRIGFWFKTSGYENGTGFTYDDAASGTKKEILIGDDYSDGEWHYIEQEFTASANESKTAAVNIYSKGKIYIDKYTFEEIDGNGNTISTLFDESFEKDFGVSSLAAARSGNIATVTWENPKDEDFLYNEIYKTHQDTKTLVAELKKGETTYNVDITSGGGYIFTVRSYYKGGMYGEKEVELWRNMTTTTTFPGWSLQIDDKAYKFRGEYKIDSECAYDGDYSAYFRVDHALESYVYMCLMRDVQLEGEKRYCFSYWFKSEDYGKDSSRFSFFDFGINDRQKVTISDTENPNGEWHNVKAYYNSAAAATKRIQIWIECYGSLWLDNIEVYEVDEDDNKIGENLLVGGNNKTDGSFESAEFSQKPNKPEGCVAEAKFRGADISWNTGKDVDSVRIYKGEDLIMTVPYSKGKAEVTGLDYGENVLKICNVSKYGAESEIVSVTVNTLPYYVSVPEFSKTNISKGDLKTSVSIANDGAEDVKTALITVLYNGKKLEKMDFAAVEVKSGEEKELSVTINIPNTTGDYSVAAYVWDDFFEAGKAYHDAEWLK